MSVVGSTKELNNLHEFRQTRKQNQKQMPWWCSVISHKSPWRQCNGCAIMYIQLLSLHMAQIQMYLRISVLKYVIILVSAFRTASNSVTFQCPLEKYFSPVERKCKFTMAWSEYLFITLYVPISTMDEMTVVSSSNCQLLASVPPCCTDVELEPMF